MGEARTRYFVRMWRVLRGILFAMEPERAHKVVFTAAGGLGALGLWWRQPPRIAPKKLWDIEFAHPIGLAAGLDKDAELLDFWAHLGFAFVEVGTVTPRPQPGNPRPRLFRIPKEQALLNRMGFNNQGAIAMAKRLEKRPADLVVGVNIGKNRDTPLEKAHEDYGACVQILRAYADFFVVNVSSPNTPGLRSLQQREALERIWAAVRAHTDKPTLLKLSPDLSEKEIEEIGSWALAVGVAGFVAGNTTTQITYPALGSGGVSGLPLRPFRERLVRLLQPYGLPIVESGGILSAKEALERVETGAALVELYTGLIYEGPGLLSKTLYELKAVKAW